MLKTQRSAIAITFAGLMLTLGGCSIDIGTSNTTPTTVESDRVAEVAEDYLESQGGSRPEIDCGTEDLELESGATRSCTVTDPETGTTSDAEVELTDVTGPEFLVDVRVDGPAQS